MPNCLKATETHTASHDFTMLPQIQYIVLVPHSRTCLSRHQVDFSSFSLSCDFIHLQIQCVVFLSHYTTSSSRFLLVFLNTYPSPFPDRSMLMLKLTLSSQNSIDNLYQWMCFCLQ